MPQKVPESKLETLAAGVAAGLSVRRAAKAAGIAGTTARRLAAEPSFKATVASIREQILSQAVGQLTRLASKSAATLGKLLDSPDPEIRLKAAREALSQLIPICTHAELNARLAALEKRSGEGRNGEMYRTPGAYHARGGGPASR
jgi:hypothetical protein